MSKTNDDKMFLEISKESMETLGFWKEEYRSTILSHIESLYKKQITDYWQITDVVMNGRDVLIKWTKRFIPKK